MSIQDIKPRGIFGKTDCIVVVPNVTSRGKTIGGNRVSYDGERESARYHFPCFSL